LSADVDEAVHVGQAVAFTSLVLADLAGAAGATRLEDLDRHAIAGVHIPSRRRVGPDLLDDPDRLVTGNEREPTVELTGVLLVIGAAQPAGLDPKYRVVVADVGNREAPLLESTRLGEHQGAGVGHGLTVRGDGVSAHRLLTGDVEQVR
jgi:hypothetical protein